MVVVVVVVVLVLVLVDAVVVVVAVVVVAVVVVKCYFVLFLLCFVGSMMGPTPWASLGAGRKKLRTTSG